VHLVVDRAEAANNKQQTTNQQQILWKQHGNLQKATKCTKFKLPLKPAQEENEKKTAVQLTYH